MPKRLLIVAGEASGDQHAARLLRSLEARLGAVSAYGLGGASLRAAGLETVADVAAISVIGVAEVLRVLPRARAIFKRLVDRVKEDPPAVAVLVDFPEFNLRLAPVLRKLGVPVVYYVSPQVWAWRRGRVHSMARSIDKMLVLFPFEADFYRDKLSVRHVGHPLVDEVPRLGQAWDDAGAAEEATTKPRIALLPGSRSSEVRRLLPTMLEAVRIIRRKRPGLRVTLVVASSLPPGITEAQVSEAGIELERVPEGDRFESISRAHLALCASGTATLEVGLLRTPMIVIYRIGLFSYWLGRLVVRVPFISLVNLVLGREVVPELIQGRARPQRIAAEALAILDDPERREAMRSELGRLRSALGASGASDRAAAEVAPFLEGNAA